MTPFLLCFILCTLVVNGAIQNENQADSFTKRAGSYEVPSDGFPAYGVPSGSNQFQSYYERATLVWYNMVRMDRISFRDNWMEPLTDASISNVFASYYSDNTAIPWNLNLNRAARAHCADRSTCPSSAVNPHNDCNNTATGTRLSKFYTGWSGEIYWYYPYVDNNNIQRVTWPFFSVAGWICDGPLVSDGTFVDCVTDNGGSDGHRQIIMQNNGEVGCGVEYSGTSSVWATCNTGSGTAYNPKIYAGAHIFIHKSASSMRYMANYAHSAPVTEASVFVEGKGISMTLESGSSTAGTWQTDEISVGSGECESYYFEFRYDGGSDRYPAEGAFKTYGQGTCETDWDTTFVPGELSNGKALIWGSVLSISMLVCSFLV